MGFGASAALGFVGLQGVRRFQGFRGHVGLWGAG